MVPDEQSDQAGEDSPHGRRKKAGHGTPQRRRGHAEILPRTLQHGEPSSTAGVGSSAPVAT